jgi:yeast amino acid transporter
LILCCMCILATIYVACSPGSAFDVKSFFQDILTLPIIVFCYILWKLWKRPGIVKLSEADLISGRRELNLREEREEEALERQNWGNIKRYSLNSYRI